MTIFSKLAMLTSVAIGTWAVSSCDSGPNDATKSGDIGRFPDERAATPSNVVSGDTISLTNDPGTESLWHPLMQLVPTLPNSGSSGFSCEGSHRYDLLQKWRLSVRAKWRLHN